MIRATTEKVQFSHLKENQIETWHLTRYSQPLLENKLETNWFNSSFGRAMKDYLQNLSNLERQKEDWQHLIDLPNLTFSAAKSFELDEWFKVSDVA